MGNLATHLSLDLIVKDKIYRHIQIFQLVGQSWMHNLLNSWLNVKSCLNYLSFPNVTFIHCQKEIICEVQLNLQLLQIHRCLCACACFYYCQRQLENLATSDPDVLLHFYLSVPFERYYVSRAMVWQKTSPLLLNALFNVQ